MTVGVIHVYALTPSGVRVEGIRGVSDAPVETCEVDGVAAIVSGLDGFDSGPTTEALLAHGRVVEALRDRSDTVLPVRFGERLMRDDLVAAIAEHSAEWRAWLERVRGCVEFAVRTVVGPTAVPAAGGSDYMRLRLDELEQTDAWLRELSSQARESVVARDHAGTYLVATEKRPEFERSVAEFTAAHPDLTVVCTGPWAPYSFADASRTPSSSS